MLKYLCIGRTKINGGTTEQEGSQLERSIFSVRRHVLPLRLHCILEPSWIMYTGSNNFRFAKQVKILSHAWEWSCALSAVYKGTLSRRWWLQLAIELLITIACYLPERIMKVTNLKNYSRCWFCLLLTLCSFFEGKASLNGWISLASKRMIIFVSFDTSRVELKLLTLSVMQF